MGRSSSTPVQDGTKQFLVTCERCTFEQLAVGRDRATRIGTTHRETTGHEIVALEVPPTF